VSTDTDLAAALLAAEPAERERLLRSADTTQLEATLKTLGHTRQAAAAEVLALVDLVVDDRALRKVARRELHRLRSMGVEPPPSARTSVESDSAPSPRQAPLEVAEAWATDIDAAGSRTLWLLADRPLGGVWFSALLLNDLNGLQEMELVETTRKRFLKEVEATQRGPSTWVSLPGAYALGLIREAVDLTREVGGRLPTRYHALRDVFGEAAGPSERALVYQTISPIEVSFNPKWLDESPRLVTEPELRGWYVSMPAELRSRALEVARTPATGLLVPGHTPEEQALQLLAQAAQQAVTPAVRRALRRRLEETAYIFVATDRLSLARLAVAAARPIEDGDYALERHPLLRMFLAAGLARLTASEMVGGRRASEALLELFERSTQGEAEAGAVETRPSGLILPR
jgi:hypothetical protein